MGTPDFAVTTLEALLDGGYNVVAVVTQPDKPVGRHGSVLQPSAVKQCALAHNLPVLQPVKMKDEAFVEELKSYGAQLQVVVAFRMLPEIVWNMPEFGTFNVHASLLPQYRGAAPINWAIINGDQKTGVTTFFLDHEIDTGRVILQKEFPIGHDDNVEYVYDNLAKLGAQTAVETIDMLLEKDGDIPTMAQEELCGGTDVELRPAPKIFKETCRINWQQSAENVHNFVRGLSPYPGTWTEMKKGDDGQPTVVKVFKTSVTEETSELPTGTIIRRKSKMYVTTATTLLQIHELQMSGKKRMDAASFLNGFADVEEYHCQ